jgi:hypothetical protein
MSRIKMMPVGNTGFRYCRKSNYLSMAGLNGRDEEL